MSAIDSTLIRFVVVVCCIWSIMFCTQNAVAEELSKTTIFGTVGLGYQANYWQPYETDDEKSAVVEYDAEGLKSARLFGNLGFVENPALFFLYEFPVPPSDEQKEMLEANKTKESGLEKFTGGIRMDPIVERFVPDNTLLKRALRKVLSVRFKYTRELYMGEGKSLRDAYYVPMDAKLNYDTHIIEGIARINQGDTLAFKAEFEDYEISIPLLTTRKFQFNTKDKFGIGRHDVRIGYYESLWKRISDTESAVSINNLPVIYEAEYRSRGLMFGLETVDRSVPGFNLELAFRMGYDDKLKTAYDWQKAFGGAEGVDSVEVNSAMIDLGLWYNLLIPFKNQQNLLITAGGSWHKRAMNVDLVTENEDNVTKNRAIHDVDYLTKFYITLNYCF